MALLLYACTYTLNPSDKYSRQFPAECLGQSFSDKSTIHSVCDRISPRNSYGVGKIPAVGFETSQGESIAKQVEDWL
jgi:hypothetical protein